jgi:uncharacterized protein
MNMQILENPIPILFVYGTLLLSLLFLFPVCGCSKLSNRSFPFWLISFVLSLTGGWRYGIIEIQAILSVILMGLSSYYAGKETISRFLRSLLKGIIIFLTAVFFLHWIPGFSHPVLFSNVIISQSARPFSLYLHYDKAAAGLLLLAFQPYLLYPSSGWMNLVKKILPVTLITIFLVILFSIMLNFVAWNPKLPPFFLYWALPNLFFACLPEEAFFRGFIQNGLTQFLEGKKWGLAISLLIPSILFGAGHLAGGLPYAVLSAIAGLGYGWSYHRTKCIAASILTHFLLNTVHFLFFTYPCLNN